MTNLSGIVHLSLTNFRSHQTFEWSQENPGPVCIVGPNGAGKTNILEALSLLSPGRGLRYASSADVQNQTRSDPWGLFAKLHSPHGPVHVGMTANLQGAGRTIHINDVPLHKQLDLHDYCQVLWITPSMDLLFKESLSTRRRFLDRLVMTYDKAYAPLLLAYEKILRQWRHLVSHRSPHPSWLESLEKLLAEKGVLIHEKRTTFVTSLNAMLPAYTAESAPLVVSLTGESDDLYQANPTHWEDACQARFAAARHTYQKGKPLTFGPQATKMHITFNHAPIEQGSTGQQKGALFSLVLSACRLQLDRFPDKPCLLLLDELSAHLDAHHTATVLKRIENTHLQMWVTGTQALPYLPQGAHTIDLTSFSRSA
ncbi:hypothetical protein EIL50_02270 [bacterium NHP-B]|nr:hypothetical protein EIL50_02270 [bacterium NHP-B]